MKLLTMANAKTVKGEVLGFLTGILYLAPHWISGRNVCPLATDGCSAACLYSAGRGAYTNVQEARIRKTHEFFADRELFMRTLDNDIGALLRKAERMGLTPAIRLNGTSDIRWETIPVDGAENIMALYPTVQFYDYTKIPNRRGLPANYHLTFSRAESNADHIQTALDHGMNVAVVFRKELPETYLGLPVINGDVSDVRFNDPAPCIVGLKAKGKARKDTSGFVVDPE
jgi:hypothetical protein